MKEIKLGIIANRKIFYTLSIVLLVCSVYLLITKGFKYGIDFKGGNIIHVTFNEATDEKTIKENFAKLQETLKVEFPTDLAEKIEVQVQATGDINGKKEYNISYPAFINSKAGLNDKIFSALRDLMPFDITTSEVSNVGSTIGDEMKRQGLYSAVLSVIGILLYLAARFDAYSALGVVIAVVHDLFITLGFISLTGIEFDTTVLAAILTLLGYSVNDSIVIFDRIRENKRISKLTNLSEITNESIDQSFTRTLNTTITTLLALFALVYLGGDSVRGFSLTLLVGCIVGTYSSLTIASPVVIDIKGDEKIVR